MPNGLRICFPVPREFFPEGEICIDLPVPVELLRPLLPTWTITKGVLDPSTAKDLSILATINVLALDLGDDAVRQNVQTAIQKGLKQPKLKGLKISLNATKG